MKILLFILFVSGSIVVFMVTDQYFFCPFYTFTPPQIFTGDSIYNPYTSTSPGNWIKCNFHTHVRCWRGLTNGHGSADEANRIYSKLGYGVHAISNYQSIDTSSSKSAGYIASYEHGYNIRKNHQLVLGADKICWKDYLFPQTTNNKQNILNLLSVDTNSLVIINHPLLRNAYSSTDVEYLTNYSCMEVLSPFCISTAIWDAALSAGKPVFIVGDDDVHNIYDSNQVGRICTWINVAALTKANILKALKTGNSYGMIVDRETVLKARRGKYINTPALQSFMVHGNTMKLKLTMPVKCITIIGKYGEVLYKKYSTDTIAYTLRKQDPYARAVVICNDGTQLFLNPVFRCHGDGLRRTPVKININKTIFFRVIGTIVLLFWLGVMIYFSSITRWWRRVRQQV